MPRHRGLSLKKFYFGVPIHLLQQYFDQLTVEPRPDSWGFQNLPAIQQWMDDPANSEVAAVVLEEWKRINDVCREGGIHLFRAYDRSQVPCFQTHPVEELAMRLFLEDRDAFEYAWSYYLLHTSHARVSQYRFPGGELNIERDAVDELEEFLAGMFEQQKKGRDCKVRAYRDSAGVIVLISRGAFMRTVLKWKDGDVEFQSFRPAIEDVLTYEPPAQRLTVRPGFNRDRELYVRAVARFLAGDQDLADRALTDRVFDLGPFAKDTFEYEGNGVIRRVALREALLQLPYLGAPTITIRSDHVVRTLNDDVKGITLQTGELKRVKLMFDIQFDFNDKSQQVVFEIEPPGFSDLSLKAHAQYIEQYLRDQGVKLI